MSFIMSVVSIKSQTVLKQVSVRLQLTLNILCYSHTKLFEHLTIFIKQLLPRGQAHILFCLYRFPTPSCFHSIATLQWISHYYNGAIEDQTTVLHNYGILLFTVLTQFVHISALLCDHKCFIH